MAVLRNLIPTLWEFPKNLPNVKSIAEGTRRLGDGLALHGEGKLVVHGIVGKVVQKRVPLISLDSCTNGGGLASAGRIRDTNSAQTCKLLREGKCHRLGSNMVGLAEVLISEAKHPLARKRKLSNIQEYRYPSCIVYINTIVRTCTCCGVLVGLRAPFWDRRTPGMVVNPRAKNDAEVLGVGQGSECNRLRDVNCRGVFGDLDCSERKLDPDRDEMALDGFGMKPSTILHGPEDNKITFKRFEFADGRTHIVGTDTGRSMPCLVGRGPAYSGCTES